jgi:flagellar biogenesis protein FliO
MSTSFLSMLEATSPSTTLWLDYARTLLVLVGICLLALVVVKVVLPRFTGFAASAPSHINVFARYPLEPRKTLYLVKTGKTVVLLAASGDAVHFMTTLNSEDFEVGDTPVQMDAAKGAAFQRFMRPFADQKGDNSL